MTDKTTSPGIHFPPPLIFVFTFALGGMANRLLPISTGGIGSTIIGKIVSLTFAVFGLGLMFWSIILFFKNRTPVYPNSPASTLVTSGPYRFSRNPMYTGLSLAYIAGAIFVNSVWPLFLLPLAIWLISRFVIRNEEQHLMATFGDEYSDFQSDVRRWL